MKKCLALIAGILTTVNGYSTFADVSGTTSSGLDEIIEIINNDEGLQNRFDIKNSKKRVTQEDLDEASRSADGMNKIILEAIKNTGIANDSELNTADARELNDYIYENYNNKWIKLHGDDEKNGEETGFHRVQNDGANTIKYGVNSINTMADGIYHLGFQTSKKNKLLNEDGNRNQKFSIVAYWLNDLLEDELKNGSLKNGEVVRIKGTTGTGLDEIIEYLITDVGLNQRVKTSDMIEGARNANEMNKIIIEAMKATGVTNDGYISTSDVRELNLYIVKNHQAKWAELHGDDEKEGEETGFHLVQSDGASKKIFGKNAVNTVFDGIYHLGFPTDKKNRLKNEDGNNNATFVNVAKWLDDLMGDDIKGNESLKNDIFTGLEVKAGDWSMLDNGYKGGNLDKTGVAILENNTLNGDSIVKFTLNATTDGKNQNGFLVFDYISDKEFKFVGARVGANYWTIGQVTNGKYKNISIKKDKNGRKKVKINPDQDYSMEVRFEGSNVSLMVDGEEKLNKTFEASFNNKIGFAADKANANFTNIVLNTLKINMSEYNLGGM